MSGIPPSSREAVMTALFTVFETLLTTASPPGPFLIVSRKLKLWDNVPAEQQPALYMVEHAEHALPTPRGTPRKTEWEIRLFIYATATQEEVGAIKLNNLLDAVDGVLNVKSGDNNLTLNGIVYRIWVEGPVLKDPGDLEGQALCLYPIKIRPP